jgi:hypothetical protein
MKALNNLFPKRLYSASNHNILAIVFVLLVILVVQYPAVFSKSVNTVFGKAIILLIVILLTTYNTLIGLAATIAIVVFNVYLFDTGYEGFENDSNKTSEVDSSKSEPQKNGSPTVSQPANVENSTTPLISAPVPPVAPIYPPAVPESSSIPQISGLSQTDLMLAAKQIVKSQDSGALPIIKGTTNDVTPSEPSGATKTTGSTLKPSSTNLP